MIAGKSSCDEMSVGLSEGKDGFELCSRVVPFQQTEIWGVRFCMGGDIFGRDVPAGVKEVKEGSFVGEETVMLFLEVETVVEVVVEMGEVTVVERRGLPQDGFFLGIFSLLPLPHCPFSSLGLLTFPYPLWICFSFW